MDALDLNLSPATRHDAVLGTDADAWFMALDERTVQVGPDTCVARVLGIHAKGPMLWIQLALCDDDETGFVLQVNAGHSVGDVLATLKRCPPKGTPLEVIPVS